MDFATSANNLYAALSSDQSQQRIAISQFSLSNAATLLQGKKDPEAIAQLKRALSLDPSSEAAYNNLGNTYLQMQNTKDAIVAYKNLIRVNPTSADAYNSLGNAYMQAGNTSEAEKQYKISAKMDPSSTYAPYTLGHMYVQNNRLAEAQVQFSNVTKIAPTDAHGYYGLALVDNKLGKFDEAITQANKALALKKDFVEPHYELGNAYVGLGQNDKAQEQVDILNNMNTSMATSLASDLSQSLFAPKIIATLPNISTFNNLNGPGTLVKSLDSTQSLRFFNTSKDFTMAFQFNTDMEAGSVTNVANWSISKATGGKAGTYNNGVTIHPESEISVPTTPKRVIYDPTTMQATLTFTVSQNALATGKIDPSHLVFQFSGVDASGRKMDSSADQVDGFAGLPF